MKILHLVESAAERLRLDAVVRALDRTGEVEQLIMDAGASTEARLSRVLLEDLDVPAADMSLAVGSTPSTTGTLQTARAMIAADAELARVRPEWLFILGDGDSALAATLAAWKRGIRVAHLEAGRRGQSASPMRELASTVIDRLATLMFVSEADGLDRLRSEGIAAERIHFTGSLYVDTLDRHRAAAAAVELPPVMGMEPGTFVLATISHVHNMGDSERLAAVLRALGHMSVDCACSVIVALHPAASSSIRAHGLESALAPLHAIETLPYVDFLCLLERAGVVVTDSGGVQEEATVIGVPCVTLLNGTNRPITVGEGTNRMLGGGLEELSDVVRAAFAEARRPARPHHWDGHAAERIASIMLAVPAGDGAADARPVRVPDARPVRAAGALIGEGSAPRASTGVATG